MCIRDSYNIVQTHVNILRRSITELRLIIENIGDHPEAINDTDFRRQLTIVNVTVVRLWEDAKRLSGTCSLPSRINIARGSLPVI